MQSTLNATTLNIEQSNHDHNNEQINLNYDINKNNDNDNIINNNTQTLM